MKGQAKVKGDKGGRFGILARCREACGQGKRPLDCAPFVPQGKRDDGGGRRAGRNAKSRQDALRLRSGQAGGTKGEGAGQRPAVQGKGRQRKRFQHSCGRPIYPKSGIHHRKMNFETEFLALMKKHNVQFDPKFVFG
jgi:hypothetical protein